MFNITGFRAFFSQAGRPHFPEEQMRAMELLSAGREALAQNAAEREDAKANVAKLATETLGIPVNPSDRAALEDAKRQYRKICKIHIIDSLDPVSEALIDRMYGLYQRTFPIIEEQEALSKIKDVLRNRNEDATARQHWVLVETPDGKIGAAVYTSTFSTWNGIAIDDEKVEASGLPDGTQHLTYILADPEFRSLGLGEMALGAAGDAGRSFLAQSFDDGRSADDMEMVRFTEQNNPFKMTSEDILIDMAGAKINPLDRRVYFNNLGFREIDFEGYIQLPLKPLDEGASCTILNLQAHGVPSPSSGKSSPEILGNIDPRLVAWHVYQTSVHSFAAGQYDVNTHPDWLSQKHILKAMGTHATVKPIQDYAFAKRALDEAMTAIIESKHFNAEHFAAPLGDYTGFKTIPVKPDNSHIHSYMPSMDALSLRNLHATPRPQFSRYTCSIG